jgi:SepF-like predicted cell division protein (DUF552 family)
LWNALLHWDKTSGKFVQINTTARDLQNLSTEVSNNSLAITDLKNVLGYDDSTNASSVIAALQQKDADQDAKIAAIEKELESVATTEGLQELKDKVDGHDTALTEQGEAIAAIQGDIGDLPEKSTVAGLITNLDSNKADKTTVNGLSTDLSNLSTTVTEQGVTIGQHGTAIGEINGSITTINNTLQNKANVDTVQALDTKVNGLTTTVNEHKALTDQNTANIGKNAEGITELNEKHTALSRRVDVLSAATADYATKTEVAGNTSRIETLEGQIKTKAEASVVEGLNTTVTNQGTAIETINNTLKDKVNVSDYTTDKQALSSEISGIAQDVQDNRKDIDQLLEDIDGVGTNSAAINELKGLVNGHTTDIQNINTALLDKADQTALNEVIGDVSDLSDKLGPIPEDSEDAYTLITKNAGAIADLQAADITINGEIDKLKAADVAINGEIDKLKAADVTIGQNISDLQNNKANLSDFNNLKTAVETIQDDYLTSTDKQSLLNKITSEINAANAMAYKGGIANSDAFDAIKASGTVSIGDTYVVTGPFGEFYAGDLVVFSSTNTEKPEQDNGYIATADLTWTRVDTGYIETHESTMSLTPVAATESAAESALLRLSSHTAVEESTMGNLGKITIKGTENITVKASGNAEDGYVLEIGMKWGSF